MRSQTVGCEEGVLACRAPNVHFYYVSFGHLGVISETLAEHPAARPPAACNHVIPGASFVKNVLRLVLELHRKVTADGVLQIDS